MTRLLFAASVVLALSLFGSSDASAQHYGCNSGYGGGYSSGYGGNYGGYGYGGGYSSPRLSVSVGYGNYGGYATQNYGNSVYNSGYGVNHGYGGHRTWHDTSHLDYHAPSLVPHRGHFDYVPGHYDVHRTGHWDRHGH